MEKEKVLAEIEEIIREEIGNTELKISFESSPDNVEGWNSMNNLLIVSAIEEKFQIVFPVEVIFSMRNVEDFCTYILKTK